MLQTGNGVDGDRDVRELRARAEGGSENQRSCQRFSGLSSEELSQECGQSFHPVVQGKKDIRFIFILLGHSMNNRNVTF